MPAALRRYWASRRGIVWRIAASGASARIRLSGTGYASGVRPLGARRRYWDTHADVSDVTRAVCATPAAISSPLPRARSGAGGALLLNTVYGYVNPYLPASLQTGLVQTGVLAMGALGLGYMVGEFVNQDIGNDVAFGGLSVVLYSALSTVATSEALPVTNNLAGYYGVHPATAGCVSDRSAPNGGIPGARDRRHPRPGLRLRRHRYCGGQVWVRT